ncbi:hypothetical protein HYDPIDRAFT_112834, partial [Hydnomerulius pinastri MD-312]
MHRCLEIPEILLEILEIVFAAKNGYPDVAGLARTCRSFNGPALDVLWCTQLSLLPLVMCFPRDVLEFSSDKRSASITVKLAKVPSVQDWERPLLHAKRIRTVEPDRQFWMVATYKLDKNILQPLLQSCPSQSLLPNLRNLSYFVLSDSGHEDASYVSLLFMVFNPSSLRSLTFRSPRGLNPDDAKGFATKLSQCCKYIESIDVSLSLPSIEPYEYVEAFASLKNLKSFGSTLLGLVDISTDSFFSYDHTLTFPYPPTPAFFGYDHTLTLPQDAFPSIRNLRLTYCSASFALQLLKSIHSTELMDINLSITGHVAVDVLRELSSAITACPSWTESMRSLMLSMASSTMSDEDVRPLLALKQLRCLCLGNTGLVLDDHLLDDMAKAWPMLEHLHLMNDTPSRSASNATLKGLVPFTRYCPNLVSVGLRLDAREIPTLSNSKDLSHPASAVEDRSAISICMDVQSEIRDSAGVAAYLLDLFPKVTLRLAGGRGGFQQAAMWQRVSRIIDDKLEQTPQPMNRLHRLLVPQDF